MSFKRSYYKRVAPVQNINTENGQPVSTLQWKFSIGRNDTANMQKSYFLIRDKLQTGDNQLIVSDIWRTYNHCATLFTTSREYINNSLLNSLTEVAQADTLIKRQNYSQAWRDTLGELVSLDSDESKRASSRYLKTQEFCWKPSAMSLFQIDKLFSCDVEVQLDFNTNFRTSAVESSVSPAPVVGTGSNNYKYDVNSIELYVLVNENDVDAPSNEVKTYTLQEVKCLKKQVSDNSSEFLEIVKCEPSVQSIVYALQPRTVQSTVAESPCKFADSLDKITNTYITYNGQIYPMNQYTSNFSQGNQETGYKIASYINNLQNGKVFESAGGESTWFSYKNVYGAYWLYLIENDPSVLATQIETRIVFNTQVSNLDFYAVVSNGYQLSVAYDGNGMPSGVPAKVLV